MPISTATAAHAAGLNCCQAVLLAFQNHHPVAPERLTAARQQGAGRAPGGRCGALHAACELLPPEHHTAIESAFALRTGAVACREIRRLRRATCADCVSLAARLVVERIA